MAEQDYNNPIKVPTVDEMSDIDFVYSIDYLSSPYYKQYMDAHMRKNQEKMLAQQQMQQQMQQQAQQQLQQHQNVAMDNKQSKKLAKQKSKNKVMKLYSKKHSAPLAIILVLFIVLIASFVLSSFGLVESVENYTSTYTLSEVNSTDAINIGLVDPIIGVVKTIMPDFNMESYYYNKSLSMLTNQSELLTQITVYAVPVAGIIILLCVLIGLIKAIVALAKKAKEGYYKKIGFGFLSLIMLISALILVFAGLYAGGGSIDNLLPFFTLTSKKINIGYALYGYIAIPILISIFSTMSYKRDKTL